MKQRSFVSSSPHLSEVDYLLLQVEQQLEATQSHPRTATQNLIPDIAGSRILPCGAVEETSKVLLPSSTPSLSRDKTVDLNAVHHYNELLAVLDGYDLPRNSSTISTSTSGGSTSLQISNITKENSGLLRNGTSKQ